MAGNAGKLEHAGKAPESGGAGSRTGDSKGKMASAVREYLLVDGYNIIFSWDELNELAKINIDSAVVSCWIFSAIIREAAVSR